jgi:chorismate synthase
MSINSVKGVEIGAGFPGAALPGSAYHDVIGYGAEEGWARSSNHAGGIDGGISNGEPIVLSCVAKPIPTLMTPLRTVDLSTRESADASKERSDVCAVPAAAVVGEAEMALVLAEAYCAKFGGDCLSDLQRALAAYRERLA